MQKARSDNKYYKAMSDLDTKESERKTLLVTRERQSQAITAMSDNEKKNKELIVSILNKKLNTYTGLIYSAGPLAKREKYDVHYASRS